MSIHKILALTSLILLASGLNAQKKVDQIYVDNNGVMRWSENKKELYGFGVNYTIPFAHEYRMAERAGVPVEEAIKQDVYHMARLDLDLYRVHVWDTEISDTTGNLINNDHLRLFDFAINEMKKRGMRFIITPIAYWGNGWPEKDEVTPGFAHKYGKGDCLTNPDAIEAQANYLNQFLKHVNSYTGVAYKDDPQIIGFEICNEPHHDQSVEKVTAFINKMVASMRQSGCSKPIFYNMSHSIHLADAYLNTNVQGGTFQWYPTNLVANHQINGNFLPHVADYTIPFGNDPRFKKMAKIVYEFDPADVGGNIMYPAIARTFRESGMQLATQFAYDAMCWAPYNTNYGTHFMNLAYAPNKAISLKITSAIFHNVPLYQKHSDKNRFDGFRISYTEDLAEWVTNEKFFYSNNTSSQPANLSQLREIAGCGSSPVVKYSGTGAYFLDKLADGIWRLEVMPDVYWIEDPYSPVNPNKQKAAVLHSKQPITISLPNLGNSFTAKAINNGNNYSPKVENAHMEVIPGIYLLKRMDIKNDVATNFTYKNIRIDEFVAPASNLNKTVLWNHSPEEAVARNPLKLNFYLVSPSQINKIQVVMSMDDIWKTIDVTPQSSNNYGVDIPAELLKIGFLNYRIIIHTSEGIITFPKGIQGDPWSWENRANEATYILRIIPENTPLILWEAGKDWESSFKIWNRSVTLRPGLEGETNLSIKLNQLPTPDPINKNDSNYTFKYFFGEKIKGRNNELAQKKFLVIKASNFLTSPQPVEIGLCDENGSVMAAEFLLKQNETIYKLSLDSLKESSFLIIPRPFPEFLSYKTKVNTTQFKRENIETLQIVIKPGNQKNVDLSIQKIWLE
jgi:hypothetical protein